MNKGTFGNAAIDLMYESANAAILDRMKYVPADAGIDVIHYEFVKKLRAISTDVLYDALKSQKESEADVQVFTLSSFNQRVKELVGDIITPELLLSLVEKQLIKQEAADIFDSLTSSKELSEPETMPDDYDFHSLTLSFMGIRMQQWRDNQLSKITT